MSQSPQRRRLVSRIGLAALSALALAAGTLGISAPAQASAAVVSPYPPAYQNPLQYGTEIARPVPAPGPTVVNPGLQHGIVGVPGSLTMTASGGLPPYSWSAVGLPPGLSINAGTGVISGTPTTAGGYVSTVTATDAAGRAGTVSFPWIISCAGTGQKLANPGFEAGAVSWSATGGVIGPNGPAQPAHTGTFDAWLDGYGTTHTDKLSQAVALPLGCTSYVFSFYLHIDTASPSSAAYDTLKVDVLNAGGTLLATLATYSNLNQAPGYAQRSFNLGPYAGQTVILRFTGTEDASLQTSFVIDDTAVNVS